MNIYAKGIAYLGPRGSFSHEASVLYAEKYSTQASTSTIPLLPYDNLAAVFQAVKSGSAGFAAVAIENNVEGFVGETLDLLLEYNASLQIVNMLWLPVQFDAVQNVGKHNIAGQDISSQDISSQDDIPEKGTRSKSDRNPETLKAHPHALAQCRKFVQKHHLNTAPALSNSAAAQNLGENELALIPHNSSTFRDLDVFEALVQDYTDAKTQFVLICKREVAERLTLPENHNIWAITPENDNPGTLLKILTVIDAYQINVSTLISRPIKAQNALYTFFLTLDADFATTQKCLHEITALGNAIYHLGYYDMRKGDADAE